MKTVVLLLVLGVSALAGCSIVPRVSNNEDACDLAKARVTELNGLPKSRIAFCDHVGSAENPPGYYLLALHSDRECGGVCSTNMGWFAVRKSNGEVFDWDMAESKLGQPLSRRQ
jgi:hypothetical protein